LFFKEKRKALFFQKRNFIFFLSIQFFKKNLTFLFENPTDFEAFLQNSSIFDILRLLRLFTSSYTLSRVRVRLVRFFHIYDVKSPKAQGAKKAKAQAYKKM
jgi:hypothetical protein